MTSSSFSAWESPANSLPRICAEVSGVIAMPASCIAFTTSCAVASRTIRPRTRLRKARLRCAAGTETPPPRAPKEPSGSSRSGSVSLMSMGRAMFTTWPASGARAGTPSSTKLNIRVQSETQLVGSRSKVPSIGLSRSEPGERLPLVPEKRNRLSSVPKSPIDPPGAKTAFQSYLSRIIEWPSR